MACPPSCLCCRLLSLSLPLNHSVPLSTRLLPKFLPSLSALAVAVAPPALLSFFGSKLHARLVDCCLEGPHPCPAPSTRSSPPPSRSRRCRCRGWPLIVVFDPPPCPHWLDLCPPSQQQLLSSLLWSRSDGRGGDCAAIVVTAQQWQHSNGSAAMAEKVAAQQWRWRRSNGNGGAAMATATAQQWRRQRSDGNSGAATADAVQQRQ